MRWEVLYLVTSEHVGALRRFVRTFSGMFGAQDRYERAWWYLARTWRKTAVGVPYDLRVRFAEMALLDALDDSIVWMDDVSDPREIEEYERSIQMGIEEAIRNNER